MKISTLALVSLIFLSCNYSKKEYSFSEYSIEDCLGKSKAFKLPSGWIKTKSSNVSYHGFVELIQYPDSSYVMILCAHQTEISPDFNIARGLNSRSEKINGTTIIYNDVPGERKAEFDFAFEAMK
tara:strand:+ start:1143 stop:1517 length:375 start_codon:yes stop_codon:yes gene_type:complete